MAAAGADGRPIVEPQVEIASSSGSQVQRVSLIGEEGAMLNRIQLIGRLTRDPELRYVSSGHPLGILSYTWGAQPIAVQASIP